MKGHRMHGREGGSYVGQNRNRVRAKHAIATAATAAIQYAMPAYILAPIAVSNAEAAMSTPKSVKRSSA
jgi:hypothetical protein